MKHRILLLAFALDLGLILTLLWLFNGGPSLIRADSPHHVALDCTGVPAPCDTSLQDAVDAAIPGDVILVASGVYSDMHSFPVPSGYLNPPASGLIAQVVYISKTLTIRGGYTPAFTDPPDPEANPTTLDARGQGRAIVIAGTVSPTLEGLRITGGDSTGLGGGLWGVTGGGGGVYVINATATISNNVVSGNSAGDGGGLFLQSSPTTLYKNTVISNTAEYGGGGVYVRESAATLSENTINANTAAGVYGSGGGVYVRQSAATLSGNTIDANTAQSNGGGIYLDNSFNAMLDWNTVISNTAISGHGGGMDVRQSDGATLNGNTVVANTAQNKGGGLHVYQSYATLIGNIVISNTADSGGGLHLVGRAVTMTANTILSNTALMGGGLYLEYNDATLNENTISFNRATIDYGEGGGIFIYDSDPALNANIITFNYADWGGGLGLYRSSPTLINTVVTDNSAGEHGSGLHIRLHSSPRLLHTTIARNLGGDGSGVYVTHGGESYCSVAMTNTILVSQTVGISVTLGDTATLESTLWYSNTLDVGGVGAIITGSHNYTGNPLFAADGYHLMPGSAAVDRGVNAGIATDVDGEPRDLSPDLGADELYSCTPVASVSVSGPVTGTVGMTYNFTATVSPPDASQPIAYGWSPEPASGQGTAMVTYAWMTTGTKLINVTMSNCSGANTASDDHTIFISGEIEWLYIHLPLVVRQ